MGDDGGKEHISLAPSRSRSESPLIDDTARLVLIGKLIIERNKRMVLQCQDILGPQSLADLRPLASLRIPQNNLLH